MTRDTLVDVFVDLVAIKGDFLVHDDGYRRRSHTYAEVGAAARGFAARLAAAGVHPGDAVVFWGENRPEWIACYWGCLIAGVVVVPIDYRSSATFVQTVYRLVGARVMLVGDPSSRDENQARFEEAGSNAPNDSNVPNAPNAPTVWRFSDLDWH